MDLLNLSEEKRARLAELYLIVHLYDRDVFELLRRKEELLCRIGEEIREAGFEPGEVEPVFDGYKLLGLRRKEVKDAVPGEAA